MRATPLLRCALGTSVDFGELGWRRAEASGNGNGNGNGGAAKAKVLESLRKRQYRVGLNLFNKKPERGVAYLTQKGFLEQTPRAVARFFATRKGVSKQMIGEYLGNLQNPFNMAALDYFVEELDLAGLEIDVALRKFQTLFRMPGEAQKIERLMEVFSHRYCVCNPQVRGVPGIASISGGGSILTIRLFVCLFACSWWRGCATRTPSSFWPSPSSCSTRTCTRPASKVSR